MIKLGDFAPTSKRIPQPLPARQIDSIQIFKDDLTESALNLYLKQPVVAVDTETRGLNVHRDRLCLVQLCDKQGVISLIRHQGTPGSRLRHLLTSPTVLKVFHFARFDMAVLKHYVSNCEVAPVFCTKVASRLVRTYTGEHTLEAMAREFLGMEMNKGEQSSDWAREDLSETQCHYAAADVRVLIPIYQRLNSMLEREGLTALSSKLFGFLPTLVETDLDGFTGWGPDSKHKDIFAP